MQDLDRSIQFYCTVLDCVVQERAVITAAEVETLTGVSDAVIHTADLKLSGGGMLELLQYLGPTRRRYSFSGDSMPDIAISHSASRTWMPHACGP